MKHLRLLAGALLPLWVFACTSEPVKPDKEPEEETVDEGNGPAALTKRGMTASYNTIFQDKNIEAIERKGVLVSWRFLSSDPDDVAFDLYRSDDGENFVKLNGSPIANSTNWKDLTADVTKDNTYRLCLAGTQEVLETYTFTAAMAMNFYRSIPLNMNVPDPSLVYAANDAAVGDLDGDGDYELVVKRMVEEADPAHDGILKGSCLLEAYELDGRFMWQVDLGVNIRQGAHYTPFIVYDLNGDGKAEVAVRTSEGTRFGDGTRIEDMNGDGKTDYRDPTTGKILNGPEYLSVIDGISGAELARADYIPRGERSTWKDYWGDDYGNRIDRFLMAVGHFGSQKGKASVVICRGYYKNFQIAAFDLDGTGLKRRWLFNTAPGYPDYRGQGNHNLAVGDVDSDGKDELVYGACCIDHDGTGLYTTKLGHGDAMHLGKFDPSRPGLQIVSCHESPESYGSNGTEFRDAASGKVLWGIPATVDVGRCMVADVDSETPGCEVWSSACGDKLWSCEGVQLDKPIPTAKAGGPSYNMGIWWSGSLNRQVLDGAIIQSYTDGRLLSGSNFGVKSINGSKANPSFYGDIWGDWREEVILPSDDDSELRIFTTDFETEYRFRPLMDDHVYRLSAVHQNIGYNIPTHTGFYLGSDL